MMTECPKHEGAFDCTPFCEVCGGEQEYLLGCICKQTDPLPIAHADGCPIWEEARKEEEERGE
jgi:hypothetical protein